MTCGIVCGFRAEQRIASKISPLTALGWNHPDAARTLIERGATRLLCFGLAGALDPGLKTGDLVLPSTIVMPNGSLRDTSPDFRALLQGAFPRARSGPIYASHSIIATAEEKHVLHLRYAAVAADMESGALAGIAAESGMPFAVLRVVSDEADDTLPTAALVGLDDNGETAFGMILGDLIGNPLQLPALLRTARQSYKALAVLRDHAPALQALLRG